MTSLSEKLSIKVVTIDCLFSISFIETSGLSINCRKRRFPMGVSVLLRYQNSDPFTFLVWIFSSNSKLETAA